MTADGSKAKRRSNPWFRLTLLLFLAIVLWTSFTVWRIIQQAHTDDARPADALVVFGAAEYDGRPSPVLKARLDHALALYQRGLAPLIITTGGHGLDPTYSEGQVGHDYLLQHGVDETHLIAESQSNDTAESAERVATILRKNGLHTCIAVSDPYHLFRVKQMLAAQGIEVHPSPRPQFFPKGRQQRLLAVARETLSYTLWRLHLT